MYSPLRPLAGLLLAISAISAQETSTVTLNETIIYSCEAAPTIFLHITKYVPVFTTETTTASFFTTDTETTTTPTTIYQTVISTTITTLIETVTATSTTVSITPTTITDTATVTDTETSTTVTPTTATATEIISEYLTTERITSVTLCPTRLVNPTYTALGPYPTDWTWGCPPGWLCKPLQDNCNFEVGTPDRNFYCAPNECIPASALPAQLPTWDANIFGNATPATDPSLTIDTIDSYFNMAPGDFGFSYQIFIINEVFTLTSTFLNEPTPTVAARQAQTSVPGACYPWCNNCLLEAQGSGKTPALCVAGSAFEVSLAQCEECITAHKGDDTGSFVQISPQFQQFLDYCGQYSTVVVTSSVTATTTNAAGSVYSVVSSTLLSTVLSTPASVPPPGPPTSVTTVVATTATVVTTAYSQTTVAATDWPQVTIILPFSNNATSTIYGSGLPIGAATLILPEDLVVVTLTPDSPVPTATATVTASTLGTATVPASPSTFTGAAASFKVGRGELPWWTVLVGLVVPFVLALSL